MQAINSSGLFVMVSEFLLLFGCSVQSSSEYKPEANTETKESHREGIRVSKNDLLLIIGDEIIYTTLPYLDEGGLDPLMSLAISSVGHYEIQIIKLDLFEGYSICKRITHTDVPTFRTTNAQFRPGANNISRQSVLSRHCARDELQDGEEERDLAEICNEGRKFVIHGFAWPSDFDLETISEPEDRAEELSMQRALALRDKLEEDSLYEI